MRWNPLAEPRLGPLAQALCNPLADPVLGALGRTLGGVLLVGLVLLLVAERHHLRQLPRRPLFQRWAVWATIAPLYTLAVLGGWLPLLALLSLLVGQALREYSRLVGLPPAYQATLLAMGLLLGPLALWSPAAFFGALPILLLLATLQPLLTQNVTDGVRWLALAAFGFACLPLLLGHLLLVDAWLAGGPGLLLVLGLSVALSDVGAFCVGRRLGRHQLAPRLSPNKTWQGLAGNVLGAALGTALLGFALPPRLPAWFGLALPLVVAVGCVWGDLLESLLKREFGTKDAGSWLPGFGGLLDRIDSLVVVAPLVYYLARGVA